MAHCLVTGGAGFIGAHLAEGLLRRGHQVRVLDNFSTGAHTCVATRSTRCGKSGPSRMREGSILDQQLRHSDARHRVVFHQAALPSVEFSVREPLQSNRVNIEGTLCVLLAARDGAKRVIYAGLSRPTVITLNCPNVRSIQPSSVTYALAKLTGEHYCRLFTELYNLETVTIRYFNVFGPRQNPNSQYGGDSKFITAFLFLTNRSPSMATRAVTRLYLCGQCRARQCVGHDGPGRRWQSHQRGQWQPYHAVAAHRLPRSLHAAASPGAVSGAALRAPLTGRVSQPKPYSAASRCSKCCSTCSPIAARAVALVRV